MTINPKRDGKHVVTGPAILRFPTLVAPEHVLDSPKKSWGATLVFPPAGTVVKLASGQDFTFQPADTIAAAEDALLVAFSEKFVGPAALAKLKASMTSPNPTYKWGVRKDGATKNFGPDGTAYINARRYEAQGAPTLVDSMLSPVTSAEQIRTVFYEGALVRASLDAYAYDLAVSKGVTFSLVNLQKLFDAPVIKYGPQPTDDFEAMAEEATPADLADVGVR